jgi:hypothetical protein
MKNPQNYPRLSAILGFIVLGILSRFLPHPPNFTALNSIALFGACFLGGLNFSLLTVFIVMLISDLVFGVHPTMLFVYFSYTLIVFMGHLCLKKKSLHYSPLYLVFSSLIFFVVSNMGSWLTDPFYSKTFAGLSFCYLSALPFLANQVAGDLCYGAILVFSFTLAERFAPSVIRTNFVK